MRFPSRRYDQAGAFWQDYAMELSAAAGSVQATAVDAAAALIMRTLQADGWVYSCGNGGSSAIANHLHCDFLKGIRTDTAWRPRVLSLSATIETLMAIGNDIGFADVFAYQLATVGRPGDLLIAVSSSGNSENIVRALDTAKQAGIGTIALTGFDGGRAAERADVSLHVASRNYGVIEDLHQSLMHTLAQYVRQNAMPPDAIASARF